jgi:predicted ester cyclase
MAFYRVTGGQIAEHWSQLDMGDLLRQLHAP